MQNLRSGAGKYSLVSYVYAQSLALIFKTKIKSWTFNIGDYCTYALYYKQ